MEGANRRAPLPEQPPFITERSTDLHYGFPGSFPGRGVESLRGLWPLSGQPHSQVAPCARLPHEIIWAPSSSAP